MHDTFRVHVKLAGHPLHEPPVLMDLSGHLPTIGQIIQVPIGSRVIRARIAYTQRQAYRAGSGIVHDVYANEIEKEAPSHRGRGYGLGGSLAGLPNAKCAPCPAACTCDKTPLGCEHIILILSTRYSGSGK